MKTHRPLFCDRGRKICYSLDKVDRERRAGYRYYTEEPQKVLDMYPAWQKQWAPNLNVLESK